MWSYYFLVFLQWTVVSGHVGHTHEMKADWLKQKWGVENVIRDLDHIKEDMEAMIELVDVGKMTGNDVAFYMVRMHDFDDNGGLDGIELRVAVTHSLDHMAGVPEHEREHHVENMLDQILEYDMNFDGIVDYGELLKNIIA